MTNKNNFYERLSRDQIAKIDWEKRCYKCGAFKPQSIGWVCQKCDQEEFDEKNVSNL